MSLPRADGSACGGAGCEAALERASKSPMPETRAERTDMLTCETCERCDARPNEPPTLLPACGLMLLCRSLLYLPLLRLPALCWPLLCCVLSCARGRRTASGSGKRGWCARD
jgi:hypothetical protein